MASWIGFEQQAQSNQQTAKHCDDATSHRQEDAHSGKHLGSKAWSQADTALSHDTLRAVVKSSILLAARVEGGHP
jgi:hypothetical protein